MSNRKKISHIIYDLDGLLLDTESIHAKVNTEVTARYGKIFTKEIKCKITGRKSLDSATAIVELLELPITGAEYLKERNTLTYQLFPQAKAMAGAKRLTQHLQQHKIPQAVATSSSTQAFQLKTSNHQQWFSTFDRIIRGDDPAIKKGKPAPDIFLNVAQQWGVNPQQCLVFEDSLAGIEAASSAGMSAIAVPDPDMDKKLFIKADLVLNSLAEFKPELWQLPAFSD